MSGFFIFEQANLSRPRLVSYLSVLFLNLVCRLIVGRLCRDDMGFSTVGTKRDRYGYFTAIGTQMAEVSSPYAVAVPPRTHVPTQAHTTASKQSSKAFSS